MIDKNFFGECKKMPLSELADICGFQLVGGSDFIISGVSTLKNASSTEISFFANKKYINDLQSTKAGAVIMVERSLEYLPKDDVVALICENVMIGCAKALNELYDDTTKNKLAMATIINKILPRQCISKSMGQVCEMYTNISKTAVIHKTAKIGLNCFIGDYVCIAEDVEIGDNTIILAHSVVEKSCKIGSNCNIRNHVTISNSIIGNDVIIHSGARIGESGFGIIPTGKEMVHIKQLGRVVIGNNVRIGANTTIDRGSIEDTVIGNHTIIDNLVQIGHNVVVGERSIIVAQVGIAGSTKIGNDVVLAGQVGVAGHIEIGNNVVAAAKSGIASSVPDKQIVGGIPAVGIEIWKRQAAFLKMSVTKKKKQEEK